LDLARDAAVEMCRARRPEILARLHIERARIQKRITELEAQ